MLTREQYVEDFIGEDELLKQVRIQIEELGMPSISVPVELGRLLTLLVKASGAKRVLEIGALGGYSGICLARGLGEQGQLVSLELKQEFADVAKANMERAGFGNKVAYRVGDAVQTLKALAEEGQRFDFVFIDADKPNYPTYLTSVIALSRSGTLIAADNAFAQDRVLDDENHSPAPEGMRLFNRMLQSDDRLDSVLLPVRDGFAIARVK